jgi:hypothetical protein
MSEGLGFLASEDKSEREIVVSQLKGKDFYFSGGNLRSVYKV